MTEHAVTREEFNRLDKQVNGNGQPGLKQTVEAVDVKVTIILAKQEERQAIDSRRWVIMTVILAALTLILGLFGLLEANRQAKSGELRVPYKSLSRPAKPVLSSCRNWPMRVWMAHTRMA